MANNIIPLIQKENIQCNLCRGSFATETLLCLWRRTSSIFIVCSFRWDNNSIITTTSACSPRDTRRRHEKEAWDEDMRRRQRQWIQAMNYTKTRLWEEFEEVKEQMIWHEKGTQLSKMKLYMFILVSTTSHTGCLSSSSASSSSFPLPLDWCFSWVSLFFCPLVMIHLYHCNPSLTSTVTVISFLLRMSTLPKVQTKLKQLKQMNVEELLDLTWVISSLEHLKRTKEQSQHEILSWLHCNVMIIQTVSSLPNVSGETRQSVFATDRALFYCIHWFRTKQRRWNKRNIKCFFLRWEFKREREASSLQL